MSERVIKYICFVGRKVIDEEPTSVEAICRFLKTMLDGGEELSLVAESDEEFQESFGRADLRRNVRYLLFVHRSRWRRLPASLAQWTESYRQQTCVIVFSRDRLDAHVASELEQGAEQAGMQGQIKLFPGPLPPGMKADHAALTKVLRELKEEFARDAQEEVPRWERFAAVMPREMILPSRDALLTLDILLWGYLVARKPEALLHGAEEGLRSHLCPILEKARDAKAAELTRFESCTRQRLIRAAVHDSGRDSEGGAPQWPPGYFWFDECGQDATDATLEELDERCRFLPRDSALRQLWNLLSAEYGKSENASVVGLAAQDWAQEDFTRFVERARTELTELLGAGD